MLLLKKLWLRIGLLVNVGQLVKILVLAPAFDCLVVGNDAWYPASVGCLVDLHSLDDWFLSFFLRLACVFLVGGDHGSLG